MRHGGIFSKEQSMENNPQLSCYFCSDVIAPTNSLSDRTLDQQCTVTRPGVSMLASAYAVELAVAAWQHKEKLFANVIQKDNNPDMHGLGYLPHQIRGFLQHYSTSLLYGKASEYCTACSPMVQNAYKQEGDAFLMRVFNSPASYLEQLTGWSNVQSDLETKLADFDFSEEDAADFDDM
jgi:ubiquitin-like modifier-activating enzyme ATG7